MMMKGWDRAGKKALRAFALVVFLSLSSFVSSFATTVPEPFIVFNNTHFANSRLLDQNGAMRSSVVYDSWTMSCSSTACTNIPDQATFLAKVATYVDSTASTSTGGLGNSFLIVLDFEDLVVDKATSQAQADLDEQTLLQFATWVHGAYPTARVGLYDYDYSTTYQSTRALLYATGGFDVFAPTLYQRWTDHTTWNTHMMEAITNDQAINPDLPIYPFISPYASAVFSDGLLSESEWDAELSDLTGAANGAIIWTQSASDTTTVSATDYWYADLAAIMSPVIDTTQTYVIKNEHTGLCDEAADSSSDSGVLQDTCQSTVTTAQEWTFQRTSLDTFYINSASASTLYLSVSGDSTVAGAGLMLDSAESTLPSTGQTWHVLSGGNGYYVLLGDGSNKCVQAPTTNAGDQLATADCAITSSQLFSIRAASN